MSRHPDTLSDEALAKMAQMGDRAAFETLCDRCLPLVFNRLRMMLPIEVVEDVTQEVFIAAMKSLGDYRSQSLFRTWLGAIARHKVVDYYRKQGRRPPVVPIDDDTENIADPCVESEDCVQVRIALQRLPAQYQEILLLRFAEGMPFEQAAQTLCISLEAAKSRYRRAVAALAEAMEMKPTSRTPAQVGA